MIAERNNEKVRKQRDSALIVLANARLMESDGWQVVISDGDGNNFDIGAFDATLPQKLSSWLQAEPQPLQPSAPEFESPFEVQEVGSELIIAAELALEERETADMHMHDDEDDEIEVETITDRSVARQTEAAE